MYFQVNNTVEVKRNDIGFVRHKEQPYRINSSSPRNYTCTVTINRTYECRSCVLFSYHAIFDGLTAMSAHIGIFWVVPPSCLTQKYKSFGGQSGNETGHSINNSVFLCHFSFHQECVFIHFPKAGIRRRVARLVLRHN